MRWDHGLLTASLALAAGVATAAADYAPLRVGVGNSPPYTYESQGKPAGIEIELLHELEKLDPGLHFVGLDQFLTVNRVIEEMNAGRLDVAMSAKTPERAARYHMLEPAIHTVRVRLLGLRDDPAHIDSLAQLAELGPQAPVLVIPGSTAYRLLTQQQGLTLDAASISVEQLIQKLALKRGRFAFGLETTFQSSASVLGLSDRLRWQPLVAASLEIHLAVSRRLPADEVARLDTAWKKLASSSKLKEIISRYSGDPIAE